MADSRISLYDHADEADSSESVDASGLSSNSSFACTSPLEHLVHAKSEPIVKDVPQVDPELVHAMQFWFGNETQVAKKMSEWKRECLDQARTAERWRQHWLENSSDEHARTLGKLDIGVLEQLLQEIGYEDIQVTQQISDGFPVSGRLKMAGHKTVAGGLLRKGKLARGRIPQLEKLWHQCAALNLRTLQRLQQQGATSRAEYELVEETWRKTMVEWEEG